MIEITLGELVWKVLEAKTEEERRKGLQGVTDLAKDEGMIFYFDSELKVNMWMKDTPLPLDIIFINGDLEVIAVEQGTPNNETLLSHDNTMYVVELNLDSGVKIGDELEFDEDEDNPTPIMKVLAPDGSTLMELHGGERIVSRRETKVLIKKAMKARDSKDKKDYKALGKYIFKVFKKLDNREPEYVSVPN